MHDHLIGCGKEEKKKKSRVQCSAARSICVSKQKQKNLDACIGG
jgi:hypothetical protein